MARIDVMSGLCDKRDQMIWEGRRLARWFRHQFGWLGIVILAGLVVTTGAAILWQQQADKAARIQTRLAQPVNQSIKIAVPANLESRSRLQAFDAFILPHDYIPDALQRLILLADTEGVSLARGEYKPDIESRGGFMRYRMTLPVKGDAQAIHRFILAALRANKTLALEAVQFKRERIESNQLEARIQWSLMTRLPEDMSLASPVASLNSSPFKPSATPPEDKGEVGRGMGLGIANHQHLTPIPPCRARLRLHTQTATQAGSMLPETPATPPTLPLKGREFKVAPLLSDPGGNSR